MREIIYIGKHFYWDSGTVMSSTYEKVGGEYKRFDWGFAEVALAKGDTLKMRPATEKEKEKFNEMLESIRERRRPT